MFESGGAGRVAYCVEISWWAFVCMATAPKEENKRKRHRARLETTTRGADNSRITHGTLAKNVRNIQS